MDVHCKEQGAKKVMCWAAVVPGKVLLHWFDERVTGDTYLKMLQEVHGLNYETPLACGYSKMMLRRICLPETGCWTPSGDASSAG